MRFRKSILITLVVLLAALALPVPLAAQHTRYKLIDLGTLGGPVSTITEFEQWLLNNGTLTGIADTSIPDPYAPNCFDPECLVQHAFEWQDGVLTDLGALPGGSSSVSNWINSRGWVAGTSQNGLIDPLTGFPETRAVLWKSSGIINLGTLGGNESAATTVNNRGQATGIASNTISDPLSIAGWGTQTRAFLWENGDMRDLGTLGGPDAFGQTMNDRGQVAGFSYTNSTPNPAIHPFLWDNGKMFDLSLGGTFGVVDWLNNRGQAVGESTLAGDLADHPFLWDQGKLMDLGTFGGSFGSASWINEAGAVVGVAGYPDPTGINHGFLWKNGKLNDLGSLSGDRCSFAYAINSHEQIVGTSFEVEGICFWPQPAITSWSAVLWENDSIIDLNSRISSNSSLHLAIAFTINERGEIAGIGIPPGVPLGDLESSSHAFLLVPCAESDEGCGDGAEVAAAATQANPAPVINSSTTSPQGRLTPSGIVAAWRARMMQRYHIPGLGPRHGTSCCEIPESCGADACN